MRNWNYPTRAAMVSYHHRAREAEVEIGYLLEGKADDELPEQHLSSFHWFRSFKRCFGNRHNYISIHIFNGIYIMDSWCVMSL